MILERIDAAEEALRALQGRAGGTVRVSAFTSAMRAFVIDAAAEVARQHPGITVQLAELEPAENVPALERGEVDLAIVADFGDGSLPHTPHLRSVPLARDELRAVLPPGTPFTGGSPTCATSPGCWTEPSSSTTWSAAAARPASSRASRVGCSATRRCSTRSSAAWA